MSDPRTPATPVTPRHAAETNGHTREPCPIPEEHLEEWRWIQANRELGTFDEYAGKHVAVLGKKILGASYDPQLLAEYLALRDKVDPEKLFIVYIDQW
jgi:hypothetical protein